MKSAVTASKFAPYLVPLAVAAFFLWNTFSAFRFVSPLVLGDEFSFLQNGIYYNDLQKLREAWPSIPQFGTSAFLWIIHIISSAKFQLDIIIKLFNLSCALIPIFAMLHLLRSSKMANKFWVIAVLLTTPVNLFASYIMPDAMYADCLLAIIAITLAVSSKNLLWPFFVLGGGLGFLCFIKPHGLFILLSATVAIGIATVLRFRFRQGLITLAVFQVSFVVGVLCFGAIFSPKGMIDPNFIGQFYSGTISMPGGPPLLDRFLDFQKLALKQGLSIIFLFAPVAFSLLHHVFTNVVLRRATGTANEFFTTFIAALPIVVAIGIVVSVSWIYYTDTTVLHARYFGVGFLSSLVIACWLDARDPKSRSLVTVAARSVVGVVWALAAVIFYFVSPAVRHLPVFSPEVFFAYPEKEFGPLNLFGSYGLIIGVSIVITSAILLTFTKLNWIKVQCGALVAIFIMSSYGVSKWQQASSVHLNFYLRASITASEICWQPNDTILSLATVGDQSAHYFAFFRVFGPSRQKVIPQGGSPALTDLEGAKCVLSYLDITPLGYQRITSGTSGYDMYLKK